MGEPAPKECITNVLPVDDGMSTPWALDLQHVWEVLLGWLAKQAKEGGEAVAEEGRGLPTSEKAWGKAPAVEPPPPEMDKEMVQWLQEEEDVAEGIWWGQDTATLVVVREAAGLLMQGQVEGLGGPS